MKLVKQIRHMWSVLGCRTWNRKKWREWYLKRGVNYNQSDEINEIIYLGKAGMSVKDISKKLGVEPCIVRFWI